MGIAAQLGLRSWEQGATESDSWGCSFATLLRSHRVAPASQPQLSLATQGCEATAVGKGTGRAEGLRSKASYP